MMRPAKTEESHPEKLDPYNLHNLTREEREQLAFVAPVMDKSSHRSPSRSPVYNRRQKRLTFLSGEEVGVVTEQVVVCPNCKHEIKLTEAISAPVVERLRKQFETDARRKGEDLARREQEVKDKSAEIEKAKKAIDAQVAER